jgi:hypothetical protein
MLICFDSNEPWKSVVNTIRRIESNTTYPIFVVEPYAHYQIEVNGYEGRGNVMPMPEELTGPVTKEEIKNVLCNDTGEAKYPMCIVVEYHGWHTDRIPYVLEFISPVYPHRHEVRHRSMLFPGSSDIKVHILRPSPEQP